MINGGPAGRAMVNSGWRMAEGDAGKRILDSEVSSPLRRMRRRGD
jgi:hypothetical protein